MLIEELFVSSEDTRRLLHNKMLIFLGDSVTRSMYKDLVHLLAVDDEIVEQDYLKAKGEASYCGDELLEVSEMVNGIQYREVREFKKNGYCVRFYFITACYSFYIHQFLEQIAQNQKPDFLLFNSAIWDVSHYGKQSMEVYHGNVRLLLSELNRLKLNDITMWLTSPPVKKHVYGGAVQNDAPYCNGSTLRDSLQEACDYSLEVCSEGGLGVLDLHKLMARWVESEVVHDGLHWTGRGHRIISTYILSQISINCHQPIETFVTKTGYELPRVTLHPRLRLGTRVEDSTNKANSSKENLKIAKGLLKKKSAIIVTDLREQLGARKRPLEIDSIESAVDAKRPELESKESWRNEEVENLNFNFVAQVVNDRFNPNSPVKPTNIPLAPEISHTRDEYLVDDFREKPPGYYQKVFSSSEFNQPLPHSPARGRISQGTLSHPPRPFSPPPAGHSWSRNELAPPQEISELIRSLRGPPRREDDAVKDVVGPQRVMGQPRGIAPSPRGFALPPRGIAPGPGPRGMPSPRGMPPPRRLGGPSTRGLALSPRVARPMHQPMRPIRHLDDSIGHQVPDRKLGSREFHPSWKGVFTQWAIPPEGMTRDLTRLQSDLKAFNERKIIR